MKSYFYRVDAIFQTCGKVAADLCIGLIGLLLLLGVPILGVYISLLIGIELAIVMGLGVVPGLALSVAILLYANCYIWEPHILPAIGRAMEAL